MTNRKQMPIWGGSGQVAIFIKGIGPSLNHGNIRLITLKLDFFFKIISFPSNSCIHNVINSKLMLKRWACSKRGLVVKNLGLGFKCINWLRFVRHTLHKMNEMHNACQDNQV